MAAASYPGSVIVREPEANVVIDLTSPARPGEAHGAYSGAKASPTTREGAPASPAARDDEDDDEGSDHGSMYEEIMDELEVYKYATKQGNDSCTAEEARHFRAQLHELEVDRFVRDNITNGKVSARKLCTAFGLKIPSYLADAKDDDAFYPLLGVAINRELNKRQRLPQYRTMDDAAMLLKKAKNVMVITGAGISTSLGIPDFRSKNTGFYSKLLEMGYHEPEQVFDIHNFDEDPTIFYKLAGDILPDLKKWTPTHEFIRLLQEKDKLLTNYTQNIDNVEAHAGIRKDKLIQCHGSWAMATCRKCGYKIPGEEIFEDIRKHTPAECPRCLQAPLSEHKPGMKRKRSSNGGGKKKRGIGGDDSESDGAYDIPQPGIMKPDITFFGEALPENFFDRLKRQDKDKADLLIVMGTSMKVAPVSEIPNFLPRDVPQIYISRDPINHINFDINLLGDCDTIVAELARRAGWDLKHKMLPEEQKTNVFAIDEAEHTYGVTVRSSK